MLLLDDKPGQSGCQHSGGIKARAEHSRSPVVIVHVLVFCVQLN